MSDYEKMSLDELKELKAKREADKLRNEFVAEDSVQAQKEKEEYDNSIREQAIKEYLKQNPPQSKLADSAKTVKTSGKENYKEFMERFVKSTGADKLFTYGGWDGEDNSKCADHDYDAWEKRDVFVGSVWHALYCHSNLLQFAVPGIDIKAGDGLNVKIRTVGKFSLDPMERSACSCLDCGETALDVYNVCVKQFGTKTNICEFDIFDIGEQARSEILKSMGFKWAEWLDTQIYNLLIGDSSDIACPEGYCQSGATHLNEETVPLASLQDTSISSDDCCGIPATEAIYRAIIDLEASMKEQSRKPTHIIMSPSVAALFKYERGTDLPRYLTSQIVVKEGVLVKIGDMAVIETCVANKLSDMGAGEVVALLIDPSRAFGFAYGKKPVMESERNIDCNSTTYVMWAYLGAAILDCESIGKIVAED